jgi:uncharacterized repeat protein (TIGR04052 family)
VARRAVILLLSYSAITGALVACSGQKDVDVAVRFAVDPAHQSVIRDLRFYVHDLSLIDAEGAVHTVKLSAAAPWQSERVALLDLAGSPADRNDAVRGTTAAGEKFNGVRLTLGVPFDLNHANPLTAAAPLNRGDLFWAWQTGYKFLRVDLAEQGREWSFHLGSTGCSSASALRPPAAPCAQPNLLRVVLRGFDPLAQPVRIDLARLMDAMRAAEYRACTGDYAHDAACMAAYSLTGLSLDTGRCADDVCVDQQLFGAP